MPAKRRFSRWLPTEGVPGRPENIPAFPQQAAVILALTLASASSDVLSYARLGGILTSAMTGNTALLGLALGEGKISAALRAAVALGGFSLGTAAASSLLREARMISRLLVIEATMLGGFAFLWFLIQNHDATVTLYTLILLSSVAMGVQSAAARQINVPGINTIVFTTTLTAIIHGSVRAIQTTDSMLPAATRQQITALAVYLCGAILTGLLIFLDVEAVVILPFAAVIAARCFISVPAAPDAP